MHSTNNIRVFIGIIFLNLLIGFLLSLYWLLMPCWVLFHRGYPRCSAVLQLIKDGPSGDSSLLTKWISRHLHSPSQTFSFLVTRCTVDALRLRKGLDFCPMKLRQVAKMSGDIAKSGRIISNKASSNAAFEVQRVLLDYLHHTRSLQFTDAEHISMNAPCFVQKILSTVGVNKHISKAVDKFLQYNPINEFEPFFESIGIQPSEIGALLPPGQIYLNENKAMMANVSTLWNYGIPRNKLGQLYKEEKEIFNYPSGVLQGKLQSYEDLGISKVSLAKIFTCCPSLLKGNFRKEFEALVNDPSGFGMDKNTIFSLFENGKYSWNGIFAKLRLLDALGCSRVGVNRLMKTQFRIFMESSEKELADKVIFLTELGLKREDVGNIILRYPGILKWNLENSMAKNVELLGSIGLEQQELRNIVQCHPYVLGTGSLKKLIQEMNEFGLDKKEIARIVRKDPKITISWTKWSKIVSEQMSIITLEGADRVKRLEFVIAQSNKHKHSRRKKKMPLKEQILRHKLQFLSELGFEKNSIRTMKVARKIYGSCEELQERINCLRSLGLSFNVVRKMIRSSPKILNQSKDLIEKKVNFLLHDLGHPLRELISYPSYLCYHLEYRIKPRCRMYEWLKEKNLVTHKHTLSTMLAAPEKRFVQFLVKLDPESPKILQNFKAESRNGKL